MSSSPKSAILGHVPGTGLYYDVDEYEEVSLLEEKTLKSQHKPNISHRLWWSELWTAVFVFVFCSQVAEYEGIKIFQSNSSIYFANSDLYVNTLKEKVILVTVCVCVFMKSCTEGIRKEY